MGFLGLLAIVFIVLKLTKVIDWSWWWVLSPIWAPLALIVAIIGLVVVFLLRWLIQLVLLWIRHKRAENAAKKIAAARAKAVTAKK